MNITDYLRNVIPNSEKILCKFLHIFKTLWLCPVSSCPFITYSLRLFFQFIEERLMMLNTGQGFSDEFEFELEHYTAKSGSKLKQQYREWTSTMKKEGTAFFKSVKDKVGTVAFVFVLFSFLLEKG